MSLNLWCGIGLVSRFIYVCIKNFLAMAINKATLGAYCVLPNQVKTIYRHHEYYNTAQHLSQICLDLVFGVREHKTSPISR